jgi:cation:H+ antiporter
MSLLPILLLIVGLVCLVVGAEWLVKGASRLALSCGISALVVGLTVVAFGTSAPELSVSVMSGIEGKSELALGNIVGSNICNVLLILGLSAMVSPLIVNRQLIRLDVPVMIVASVVFCLMCLDGKIGFLDGLILSSAVIAYTWWLIRSSRREQQETDESAEDPGPIWINVVWIGVGLGLLVLGSRFLVESAITIAQHFQISETVIGLTIVAVGTSLPELATSVIASIRGQRDIAVGNVVGSNVFNLLAVGGFTGLLSPAGITVPSAVMAFDLPFMLAVALACFPIFIRGFVITRWNGLFFFSYYIVYTTYLIMGATNHDQLPLMSKVLLEFLAPLTGVMLVLFLVFEWRLHSRKRSSDTA